MMTKFCQSLLLWVLASFFLPQHSFAQKKQKTIPLPASINGINEEFSGMDWSGNRLYLLPQYGSHKETKLDGEFSIYSLLADSIGRVIDKKDSALTNYKTIAVKNLAKLPDSIKKYYQGFEAITFVDNQVFLAIETDDKYDYCFLIKGTFNVNKNEISIDPKHFISLKRYPYIANAGFESIAYLPGKNKLLALFEFNGMIKGGIGFLIDTAFIQRPKQISVPFLPFRITDIQATRRGTIYGINYYWAGDYESYLDNPILRHPEEIIKNTIPDLKDSLTSDSNYLKHSNTTYARIVYKNSWKSTTWKQVVSFDGNKNNWEGLALYRKGALICTDANRNNKQYTTLAFIEF